VNQPDLHISPDDRADESVRKILYPLFGALRSNVEGVLENEDVEFLHDFRVANRRTRTALSQTKGVLPSSVMDTFPPEFKWLGDVTGPCRDLDVMLLETDSYLHHSDIDDGSLGALRIFLKEKHRLERGHVRAALQSERFQRLTKNWSRFLETGAERETEPPLASSPIIEVAGLRILKAYRRIRERGVGIDVDPSAALLHRLRIDGKKLRYLLEFFSDLYPRSTALKFIRELKQLQDILGSFNDTEVQFALIEEFKDQGSGSAEAPAPASRLAETVTERRRELRAEFAEHFELFTSEANRKLYKKTFKIR
jgi:CHAD domain-containing protein